MITSAFLAVKTPDPNLECFIVYNLLEFILGYDKVDLLTANNFELSVIITLLSDGYTLELSDLYIYISYKIFKIKTICLAYKLQII